MENAATQISCNEVMLVVGLNSTNEYQMKAFRPKHTCSMTMWCYVLLRWWAFLKSQAYNCEIFPGKQSVVHVITYVQHFEETVSKFYNVSHNICLYWQTLTLYNTPLLSTFISLMHNKHTHEYFPCSNNLQWQDGINVLLAFVQSTERGWMDCFQHVKTVSWYAYTYTCMSSIVIKC